MISQFQVGEVVKIDLDQCRHFPYGVILHIKRRNLSYPVYISLFSTLWDAIDAVEFDNKAVFNLHALESTGHFNDYQLLMTL